MLEASFLSSIFGGGSSPLGGGEGTQLTSSSATAGPISMGGGSMTAGGLASSAGIGGIDIKTILIIAGISLAGLFVFAKLLRK